MPVLAVLVARHRTWVLAAAALLGLAAAGGLSPSTAPRGPAPPSLVAGIVAEAIPAASAASLDITIAANESPAKAADPATPPAPAAAPAEPTPPAKASKRKGHGVGITIDDDDEGTIRINGPDGSREYDSFESFIERAPWVAGLVFGVTFLVFLTPILIIGLVIWYKVRKSRMLNETMIKLAEKGVVPSAEAYGVIAGAGGTPRSSPSAAPIFDQARAIQKRAAWSDLRKGIILGAVGLGFTMYSMLEDGAANFVGLVLMFVGLGYIVLWYFEDRQLGAARVGSPPPPPSPPTA